MRQERSINLRLHETSAGVASLFRVVIYNDFCNPHVPDGLSAQDFAKQVRRRWRAVAVTLRRAVAVTLRIVLEEVCVLAGRLASIVAADAKSYDSRVT